MTYDEWCEQYEAAFQARDWESIDNLWEGHLDLSNGKVLHDLISELTEIERFFTNEDYDDIALSLRTALNEMEAALGMVKRL